MGVLNKYGFVDYFKMKDRIRNSTANKEPTLEAIYLNAFNSDILYDGHCNSPKKLLNVLDSMLMVSLFFTKVRANVSSDGKWDTTPVLQYHSSGNSLNLNLYLNK